MRNRWWTQAACIDSMSKKKSFPLRLNEEVLSAVQKWAADDLRSVNAQIEYLLRESMRKAGRMKKPKDWTYKPHCLCLIG